MLNRDVLDITEKNPAPFELIDINQKFIEEGLKCMY